MGTKVDSFYKSKYTGAEIEGSLDTYKNTASEYSASSTYSLNALVLHDNKLYKCNTAIVTPEVWTPAHWTQTYVADYLAGSSGDMRKADYDSAETVKNAGGIPSYVSTRASKVSVSASGSATDTVQYITVDGVEKKLAGGGGELPENVVYYDDTAVSTQADGCVHYDRVQSLTDAEKTQARNNIGTNEALLENVTYYCDETNGSDTTGTGTQANPFKTVNYALSLVPKNLDGNSCTIYITNNIASGININNFYAGSINISVVPGSNISITESGLSIRNCDTVTVSGITSISNSATTGTALYIEKVRNLIFYSGCTFSGGTSGWGIQCYYSGNVVLTNNNAFTVARGYYGVTCSGTVLGVYGTLTINSGRSLGIKMLGGGLLMCNTITNSATTKYQYSGGTVIKGTTINPTT